MIVQSRAEYGGVGQRPALEHVRVAAERDGEGRVLARQRVVVDVHAQAGPVERAAQENEGHLETGHALLVRTQQGDRFTDPAPQPAIAGNQCIAIAVLEKEQDVATEL
jgi:hypothetical protein